MLNKSFLENIVQLSIYKFSKATVINSTDVEFNLHYGTTFVNSKPEISPQTELDIVSQLDSVLTNYQAIIKEYLLINGKSHYVNYQQLSVHDVFDIIDNLQPYKNLTSSEIMVIKVFEKIANCPII